MTSRSAVAKATIFHACPKTVIQLGQGHNTVIPLGNIIAAWAFKDINNTVAPSKGHWVQIHTAVALIEKYQLFEVH